MKATELRIGNLTLAKSPEKTEWIEGHPISIFDLNYLMYPKSKGAIPIDLKPIPLTEEWLVRFGFEMTYESNFRKCYDIEISNMAAVMTFNFSKTEMDKDYIQLRGVPLNNEVIKYVHQLQNLYFALTGEELELRK